MTPRRSSGSPWRRSAVGASFNQVPPDPEEAPPMKESLVAVVFFCYLLAILIAVVNVILDNNQITQTALLVAILLARPFRFPVPSTPAQSPSGGAAHAAADDELP